MFVAAVGVEEHSKPKSVRPDRCRVELDRESRQESLEVFDLTPVAVHASATSVADAADLQGA